MRNNIMATNKNRSGFSLSLLLCMGMAAFIALPAPAHSEDSMITLWGSSIACPSGWNQAYTGRRFEILGVTGGMNPTADKQPQCIKGLSLEILKGQQRVNTNGFDQQLFYGSAFYYSGVGGVFISPMNVECTVCVKDDSDDEGGNNTVVIGP